MILRVAAPLVCLWVLAANTYDRFDSVRVKIVREPAPAQSRVLLPLEAAAAIPDPYIVVVYQIRNLATETMTIDAELGGRVLRQTVLSPQESARVDLALSQAALKDGSTLRLTGNGSYRLEFAEIANLHGFTRGALEFVILPPGQPFARPPLWTFGVCAIWVLLAFATRARRWPRLAPVVHLAVSGLILLFLLVVALSALLSGFRVVLALQTLIVLALILEAPRLAYGVWQAGRVAAASARRSGKAAVAARAWGNRALRSIPAWIGARAPAAWHVASRLPWLRIGLALACVAYAVLLWPRVGAVAAGADSSGYLNAARMVAQGRVSTPIRTLASPPDDIPPIAFEPLGLRLQGSDRLVPSYPIGLSLMLALTAFLTGWDVAPDLIMISHAVAGLLLAFALARECGLSAMGAVLAVLLLATSPLFLFMSLMTMSDTPALVWVTGAVLLAWRSQRSPRLAFWAGAALAIAVLTRPTNLLALAPIAVCLGGSPRRWFWLGAGGAPGAAALAWFNGAAYGGVLTTGYAPFGDLFALQNVAPSLVHYASWLPVLLTPLGVMALGLPALLRQAPRLVSMLIIWIAAFLGFYAFYAFTHQDWWFLRFVLPAFPPLIVGALWVGRTGIDHVGRAFASRVPASPRRVSVGRGIALGVLAASVLAHNVSWNRSLGALVIGAGERVYRDAADWARANVPPDAAMFAFQMSGSFFYYTDFPVVRWDNLRPDQVRRIQEEAVTSGQPLYAVLFPHEIEELSALRDRLPGTWTRVGAVEHISFWRFTG